MLNNRTTRTQTTTSGNFNNSTSTLGPEPMIQVPLSAFQTMNQSSSSNSEALVNKPFFSTNHVLIILGVVISAVLAVAKIYFDLTSDIKNLNKEINDLSEKYTSLPKYKLSPIFFSSKPY